MSFFWSFLQGYSSLEKKVAEALDLAGGGVAANNKVGVSTKGHIEGWIVIGSSEGRLLKKCDV